MSISDSQSGFVPERGTTDAIFVVRQMQEKRLVAKKNNIYYGLPGPNEGI